MERSLQAITRQELTELLGKVVGAGFSKPELAKPYEALKAAELLAKLQGYNEPERSNVQHLHVMVDQGVIEQLKLGHAAMLARSVKACLPLPSGSGVPLAGPQ